MPPRRRESFVETPVPWRRNHAGKCPAGAGWTQEGSGDLPETCRSGGSVTDRDGCGAYAQEIRCGWSAGVVEDGQGEGFGSVLTQTLGRNGRTPKFQRGQVVRHRRYGYRGVIVDYDHQCQADERWYKSNQSQPDRNQPWYHVLVDGSEATTYAAQVNLAPDTTGKPVEHPLVERYFCDFSDGRHVRNETAWPE